MKRIFFLSALALASVTTFAQSQKTNANAQAPVANLTANAVATPANSAPVQKHAATPHDAHSNNAIAKAQPATKATDAKKSSGNSAANKNTAATPAK